MSGRIGPEQRQHVLLLSDPRVPEFADRAQYYAEQLSRHWPVGAEEEDRKAWRIQAGHTRDEMEKGHAHNGTTQRNPM